ncbi:protein PLASTID MOVEMENT IMPAIRED 1-RELATED 2-like [Hibiscus syriacus]|uniref:protein PLASTID MOVEMENT IMPAIRED 1-RELATED 2-like n=1 Tax=Hibiscus syriacus TaxID=106335 RepID=UPI0019246E74|nr:protein PLASTID MOVEMENT IMPAIRED 1-RELATED 2-like [Hibiscus syriacus]
MEKMMNDGVSDCNNTRLLREIEEISKALYLQKPSSNALIITSNVRSQSAGKTHLSESKSKQNSSSSSSLWNWKNPFKTLAHIRRHRFDICFFLHVHSIEGLPAYFNDSSLCVHWKGKDEVLSTRAVSVVDGIAEFEETLMVRCCVLGSRSGPRNSAKYEVELFVIYASVAGASGHNMGEDWIDLTRLLPLTFEDLVGEKRAGKWTTSFELSGKARGATLNVSFSFLVTADDLVESSGKRNGMLQNLGTLPINVNRVSYMSPLSVDIKFGSELLPNLGLELSKSISFLYQKLNEGNLHRVSGLDKLSEHVEPPISDSEFDEFIDEYENIEFSVIEKGVEMCQNDQSKLEQTANQIQSIDGPAIETINVEEILRDCDTDIDEEAEHVLNVYCTEVCTKEVGVDGCMQEKSVCSKPMSLMELESDFHDLLIRESSVSESSSAFDEFIDNEKFMDKASKSTKKSRSLDEIADTVASDFLKMLEIEHGPFSLNSDDTLESPRERLLREFETEALASGDFILDFGAGGEDEEDGTPGPFHGVSYDDFAFSSVSPPRKEEKESPSLANRRSVKMLEYLETEALMREWGLDENAFQRSPCVQSDGFGSPIELSPERLELPPLGEGLGHFILTKDGGVLRSMNPSHFINCKNVGYLVMQVSRAAVFPARLGIDVMEILRNLASLGIENLSMKVNNLMPLDDITGKTLQKVALEAAPTTVVLERWGKLKQELLCEQDSLDQGNEVEGFQFCWTHRDRTCSGLIGCVSMENLVPSVMNRIEALALEGLRIQCGMSDEDAPSSVGPSSPSDVLFTVGKDSKSSNLLSFKGAASSQSLDFRDVVNRLMSLVITLDEWLRLDGGVIDDGDHISDHTIQILEAYQAKCLDSVSGNSIKHVDLGKESGRKHGLLGNNLTLAVKVLLRDPFRNYEPVGTSMMALIQVQRAHVALEPQRDREENPESEAAGKKEGTPFFDITEVHLAGLNTEPDKQHLWGSKAQQQSGTRWMLASGTANSKKKTFSKSKAIVKFYPSVMRKSHAGSVLWSLTSNVDGISACSKGLADSGQHYRNPNVIFLN